MVEVPTKMVVVDEPLSSHSDPLSLVAHRHQEPDVVGDATRLARNRLMVRHYRGALLLTQRP